MTKNDLIFPKIRTKRLILNQFDDRHIGELFEIFGSTEAMQYYDLEPFSNPEQCLELIDLNKNRFENKTGIRWGIFLEKKLIGTCGFNAYRADRKGVIGYDLQPAYWGKGITTEALQAIVDFGFNNLQIHRIEAYVTPGNLASEKVLIKTGFELEGKLKDVAFFKNKYQDQLLYAKINPFK